MDHEQAGSRGFDKEETISATLMRIAQLARRPVPVDPLPDNARRLGSPPIPRFRELACPAPPIAPRVGTGFASSSAKTRLGRSRFIVPDADITLLFAPRKSIRFRSHNPKVGGSNPPPATTKVVLNNFHEPRNHPN